MQVDSDGNTADLSVLISQLLDFFTAIASSSRSQNFLKEILPHLLAQTLGEQGIVF